MTGGFNEVSTIQKAIVERLVALGWTHVPGNQLDRSIDGVFIEPEVVAALVRLNGAIAEQPERVDEVLPRLRVAALGSVNEGLIAANERMTTWLRGHETQKYLGAEAYESVRLIDFDDISNNHFFVSGPGFNHDDITAEVTYGHGPQARRFDVVLWVNGFPLVVGETKSPVRQSESWLNAARDIHDVYEVECATFFAPNLLSFATDGREFHYGAIGQPVAEWLMWGSTTDPFDLEAGARVMRSVELLLRPERVLSILRDFTLYDRPVIDGRPTRIKLIPRYPQVEAAELIHERVLAPDRQRGLIWHYQGTGKTLLMAFAALKLLNHDDAGAPTVLIVLDRIDLVEQTVRQFQTAGLPRLRVAGTKEKLRELLAEGQRGIIVTTIFRFDRAGFLNDRGDIVVLIDEAHRTQEGSLGSDMRQAIPNAQFFGLTGTPIADADRNTFKLFGDPNDPGFVLNQYSMERSIADGSSVPIHVEPRLVDFNIDREALDEAFTAMAEEERLDEQERELLAERAASAKAFMRNPERIRAVCADIVEHFHAKVDPLGLKAQVVAFDRELCVFYFDEITRLLGELGEEAEAAVVMTVGTSKSEPSQWRDRFALTPEEEAKVKARFLDHGDPLRFLVVTAKLLTGFDAPIEGVMYLDKPLRLHTLFQAITRTNRRWTNPVTGQEKHYGLIVDYVGLGSEIAKSLRAADPERGGKRPVDTEGLLAEFATAMGIALARFEGIDRTDFSFAALTAAQERVPSGEARDAFAREFLTVHHLWEFLYPTPALNDHRSNYRWVAQVYESIQPTAASDALLWHRLGAKTLALVHGHITDLKVTGTGLAEVIVDVETIEAIRQLAQPGTYIVDDGPITVAEALDTIGDRLRRRLDATGRHPVYVALSERLERLRRAQLDKASASVEFLRELLELAQQVTAAERAEEEGGSDALALLPNPNIGALTQIFREYAPPDAPVILESVVADIDTIVRQVSFAGWNESQAGDRTVRREVRLVLKKYALPTTGELFDRAYAYIRENY